MTREPSATVLHEIHTVCPDAPDDVLLFCASYEPRTTAIANLLVPTYRCKVGLLYVNEEFLDGPAAPATKANLAQLQTMLQKRCDIVYVQTGSWLVAEKQLESLRHLVRQAVSHVGASASAVSVDTTTFTRESLLVACALLRQQFPAGRFRMLYSSPKKHGKWLSHGFRCVRNVIGFAGIQLPARSTVLIVLSGFEGDRTLRLIEEHEPYKILLGLGNPPTAESFFERNEEEIRKFDRENLTARLAAELERA